MMYDIHYFTFKGLNVNLRCQELAEHSAELYQKCKRK